MSSQQKTSRSLIVSDLDGTLLDHHNYDFSPALPALQRLQLAHTVVVLNTSKTASETAIWHRQLQLLEVPYVVENGAALISPNGQLRQSWGRPRLEILELLHQLRESHGWSFLSFDDMGVDGICRHTGLAPAAAERALARAWSEPLKWLDSESALTEFREQLSSVGLQLLRGGRFFHVQAQHDKATPLAVLRELLDHPLLIALGDGQNDAAMLNASDIAIRVRSPVHPLPALAADVRHFDTQSMGPQGWCDAINQLFEQGILNDE